MEGIPVVAANMDTTGTFEIAKELQRKIIDMPTKILFS